MTKFILLALLISIGGFSLQAQECLPNGLFLGSQSQVDSFPINYPGCSTLNSYLTIIGSDITNLDSLYSITEIEGSLFLNNTELVDLGGFENLTSVGGNFNIGAGYSWDGGGNPKLENITALSSLTELDGGLFIMNNDSLKSIVGLEGLTVIQGGLTIDNNDSLTVLTGLNNLSHIGGELLIRRNPITDLSGFENLVFARGITLKYLSSLESLMGFDNLTDIEGDFILSDLNALTSVESVSNLETIVGDLELHNIQNLQHINGFTNLKSISGDFHATYDRKVETIVGFDSLEIISGEFKIESADSLELIAAFDSLKYIGGTIELNRCEKLDSINGMHILDSIHGDLIMKFCYSIEEIDAFNSLQVITGKLEINRVNLIYDFDAFTTLSTIGDGLFLMNIDNLSNLDNFSGLTNLNGTINISNNDSLVDLSGLENINPNLITSISISYNHLLSNCAITPICERISINSNNINFTNNDTLCSSFQDVYNACFTGPCLEDGIVFTSQAQVDSFPINYQYCTQIQGDVEINGSDITNLDALDVLTDIEGSLWIHENPLLLNLVGLISLDRINGSLTIEDNDALVSLSGLDSIEVNSIDEIHISNNSSLSNCSVYSVCYFIAGAEGIIEIINNAENCNSEEEIAENCIEAPCFPNGLVFSTQAQIDSFIISSPYCPVIEGDLWISGNNIQNVEGLSLITQVNGNMKVSNCDSLESLEGLHNINMIGGDLDVEYNPVLTNINAFSNLEELGGELYFFDNPSLISLNGLEGLTAINGRLNIRLNNRLVDLSGLSNITSVNGDLNIEYNDSLLSLNGLENLLTINGALRIAQNPLLNTISSIASLDASTINFLLLGSNPSLSVCNYPVICDYINSSASYSIYYNAPGCSQFDLEIFCLPCIAEGISFTSQAEIDSFPSLYSDCFLIDGDVIISGDDITNLDSLWQIQTINGNLSIEANPLLTDCNALQNLINVVGSITIDQNSSLESIEGIRNVEANSLSALTITENPSLSYCSVESVCAYLSLLDADIEVSDNLDNCNSESEISSFCNLSSCLSEGITFTSQSEIDNFPGNYQNCAVIDGNVVIEGDDISNVDSLLSIVHIHGSLSIIGNPLLDDLIGLQNLAYVDDELKIMNNEVLSSLLGLNTITSINTRLRIWNNESLVNLFGLENLTSIHGEISVDFNDQLNSIASLEAIDYLDISQLSITNNPFLSDCAIESFCSYLSIPSSISTISDNLSGCNTVDEVLAVCTIGIEESNTAEHIEIYPNPANDKLFISAPSNVKIELITLYNQQGQKVIESGVISSFIDLRTLHPGVYIIAIQTERSRWKKKLIIQK